MRIGWLDVAVVVVCVVNTKIGSECQVVDRFKVEVGIAECLEVGVGVIFVQICQKNRVHPVGKAATDGTSKRTIKFAYGQNWQDRGCQLKRTGTNGSKPVFSGSIPTCLTVLVTTHWIFRRFNNL